MASLDLTYVDELINVRQTQHGGNPGAPPVFNGYRVGASLNRSCIVMLSALLQAYVEEVYKEAAVRKFPALAQPDALDRYWKQMKSWGNPSDSNIQNLFMKLGAVDIFDGLSWTRCPTQSVKEKLSELNQIRNKIAHGASVIVVNNSVFSLKLSNVIALRNFSEQFGRRFESHVASRI